MAVEFFAVRRSSEIAQLVTSDVVVHEEEAVKSISMVRQKNDPLGRGQLAYGGRVAREGDPQC